MILLLVLLLSAYAANLVGMFFWVVYVALCRPDVTDRQIVLNLLIPLRFLWCL